MTVEQLFQKLSSKEFKDTENGDLFYNFFIFQYPANKEYEIRQQIQEFKVKLIRPCNYIYNPQIEMFARFKMKSSFHKTKRII